MFTFTALLAALFIDRLLGFHSQKWIKPGFNFFVAWIQRYQSLAQLPAWANIAIVLIPLILISSIVWLLLSFTWITQWLGMTAFIWAALGAVDTPNLINSLSASAKESKKVVAHAIYWQAGQATFSVIFWLMITGPIGAISYRWIALTKEEEITPETTALLSRLQEILDWLPMRLFSATLILVDGGKAGLRLWWQNKTAANQKLIDTCGEEHALDRVNRSLYAWLLVLAVWALVTYLI
jgi:AmpE protein